MSNSFLGNLLQLRKKKHNTVSKELLAIGYILSELRISILGQDFTLYADSNVVKWLFAKREISAKYSRYIMLLQDFPCKVTHIPGKMNGAADILSRYPLTEPPSSPGKADYFSHILMLEQ